MRVFGLFACAWLAHAAAAQDLVNAGFEEPGSPPPGWTMVQGAGAAGGRPSVVEVDASTAAEGRSSLKLSGDADTWAWQFVSQTVEAEPARRYTLRFQVESEDVRREAQQFYNAYVRLGFLDAGGKLLERTLTPSLSGSHPWSELVLTSIAPDGAARVEVAVFLSMSGTLRLDDVRLESAPTEPFDRKTAGAAFDALEGHLRRTYPFFGLGKKPLPDKLFKSHRSRALKAKGVQDLAESLGRMLDELDDLHVHLRAPEGRISTGPRGNPNPTNWNMEAVGEVLGEPVSKGASHLVARTAGGYGYVRLTSFGAEWEEIRAVDAAMDRLGEVGGWVFDVRPNGGGGEDKAQFLAARFVDGPLEYARSSYRDPFAPDDTQAFGAPIPRHLRPREGREGDRRPVVVLQGPFCVSSTEGFLLMMKAVPTATLVGLPSRGASGNPQAFTVLPELELVASTWRSLTLEDECIEGVGVQPDVVVEERPSKYRKADPTFERGLEVLAGGR